MNTPKGIVVRLLAAAAAAVVLTLGVATLASAQEEMVSIDSASVNVGAEGAVGVDALNIPEPGLGAWTIDVTYDPAVLTPTACIPEQGGVCNPAFESNIVRITGASASGVVGSNSLGAITFRCETEGSSALNVSVPLIVDATVGDPQPIVAGTQNGSVACSTAPTDGGGSEDDIEDVFDCSDFVYRDVAQAILDSDPSDPHGLDPDGDGLACEELPERGDADSFPSTGVGGGDQVTTGQIARWLMAAFAGVGVAMAGGIGLLRWRAERTGVRRR